MVRSNRLVFEDPGRSQAGDAIVSDFGQAARGGIGMGGVLFQILPGLRKARLQPVGGNWNVGSLEPGGASVEDPAAGFLVTIASILEGLLDSSQGQALCFVVANRVIDWGVNRIIRLRLWLGFFIWSIFDHAFERRQFTLQETLVHIGERPGTETNHLDDLFLRFAIMEQVEIGRAHV